MPGGCDSPESSGSFDFGDSNSQTDPAVKDISKYSDHSKSAKSSSRNSFRLYKPGDEGQTGKGKGKGRKGKVTDEDEARTLYRSFCSDGEG